ncbi:MAG: type III pantothenate kinase [Dehalococcoidales bacterium]|nr:MAG: type III pantothenate kinase [Dehalococcoidales bacterium]
MLLVIDTGNTNVTIGVFEGDTLRGTWRIYTRLNEMADEYAVMLLNLLKQYGLQPTDIDNVAISCVVPPLRSTFNELFQKYFNVKPLMVGPGIKTGISIRIDSPREVGSDRIANAAAAHTIYKDDVIVVAMGTATVFDTVSKEGDYLGGAVAPGFAISAEALFTRTAALPRVEFIRPKKAIGTSTVTAIQSGLIFGYAGLIEGVVSRIQDELGKKTMVVATGGYAELVSGETRVIDTVNPDLTLLGLKIIYEMNTA